MTDVTDQINSVRRVVGSRTLESGAARVTMISQSYNSAIDDVWDACTNAERIPRWFLPVTGELRVGGRYQLEGNAGGTVQTCNPPESFTATWEYGGDTSWIELRLVSEGAERTRFELEHIAHVDDERWTQCGPGAVGIGWELSVRGLAMHLASGAAVDPAAFEQWSMSPEGIEFITASGVGWSDDADIASGTDPEHARTVGNRTIAFYTGAENDQEVSETR